MSYLYGQEVRYVDERGRTSGGFPVAMLDRITQGRFTSLRRSDLAATLYAAVRERVQSRFGDSIAAIDDRGKFVRIAFDRAAPCDVDLVVGADGLHSRVRRLVFGTEKDVEVTLGYHVAAFEVDGYLPRDELVSINHAVPGRQISRITLRDDKTLFLLVFRDEYMPAGKPSNDRERKAVLRYVFGDVGWEAPGILVAMDSAHDLYFDRVSQIRMENWTSGRAAVIGDAAACVSLLAGEGTGLAIMEAYVLAGELRRSGGDHSVAFARYQELMGPFLRSKQDAAAGFASFFAPRTAVGIHFRNLVTRLFRIPFVLDYFIGRSIRDDVVLPDYAFDSTAIHMMPSSVVARS